MFGKCFNFQSQTCSFARLYVFFLDATWSEQHPRQSATKSSYCAWSSIVWPWKNVSISSHLVHTRESLLKPSLEHSFRLAFLVDFASSLPAHGENVIARTSVVATSATASLLHSLPMASAQSNDLAVGCSTGAASGVWRATRVIKKITNTNNNNTPFVVCHPMLLCSKFNYL